MSEKLLKDAAESLARLSELAIEIREGRNSGAALEVLSKTKELHRLALEIQDELMGRLFRKEVM